MRIALAIVTAVTLSAPAVAQAPHDPDHNAQGGVQVSGWQARLDRATQKVENLKFVTMGQGLHATTGPAAIFFKPENTAKGEYQVTATFVQSKLPEHQEAYGVFIGGSDLTGDAQRYTYFLVRQDGKFLVKRRDGAETKNVVDWTEHVAVQKPDAQGQLKNTLTIAAGKDKVRFLVNGTEVASQARTDVDADGIVGLRVNHNLDVHIDGFKIARTVG
ncbi:MAG: hypothetical protein HYX76_11595 [Acidobacteria bacterium]|nr:hypothetical protein [Acidobacteriota bacterium]